MVSSRVQALLPSDEEVIKQFSYNPILGLFQSENCYLTENRIIHEQSGLLSDDVTDVELGKITGISFGSDAKGPLLAIGGVGIGLGVLILTLMIGNAGLEEGALPIGIGALTIGVVAYVFAKQRSKGFVIQTANPDVSITLPTSRRNAQVEQFIQSVRENTDT